MADFAVAVFSPFSKALSDHSWLSKEINLSFLEETFKKGKMSSVQKRLVESKSLHYKIFKYIFKQILWPANFPLDFRIPLLAFTEIFFQIKFQC